MTRFFTENILKPGVRGVTLSEADSRHAREVLRMRSGDRFVLCDGARRDHVCVVDRLTRDVVSATIESVEENRAEPVYDVVLYQGLPKGDKMDDIVRKAVELGVARIVPVVCARSVPRPGKSGRARTTKVERWNRIAREAAKQCGRGRVPVVNEPVPFVEACRDASDADLAFMPWENERSMSILQLLREFDMPDAPTVPSISFLIGPEGGFEAAEVDAAATAGIRTVSLGRRILRTETAGPAVLAMMTCLLDLHG